MKETGELVEVHTCDAADFQDRKGNYYWEHQLYFGTLDDFDNDEPDYWTRLEHQYAGMAMQGLLNNNLLSSVLLKTGTTHEDYINEVVNVADEYAKALITRMKNV